MFVNARQFFEDLHPDPLFTALLRSTPLSILLEWGLAPSASERGLPRSAPPPSQSLVVRSESVEIRKFLERACRLSLVDRPTNDADAPRPTPRVCTLLVPVCEAICVWNAAPSRLGRQARFGSRSRRRSHDAGRLYWRRSAVDFILCSLIMRLDSWPCGASRGW